MWRNGSTCLAEFRRDFVQAWQQAEVDDNMPESSRAEFVSDHVRLDQRSLALHFAIAEKIKADPALLDKALQNIKRWKAQSSSLSDPLDEWEAIINQGVDKMIEFMRDPSEEATRLRQSSPFAGILTEAERLAIFDAFSKDKWGK